MIKKTIDVYVGSYPYKLGITASEALRVVSELHNEVKYVQIIKRRCKSA